MVFHVIVGAKELVLPLFVFCEIEAWPLEVDAQCQNLILLLTQFLFHLPFLYNINFCKIIVILHFGLRFLSDLKYNVSSYLDRSSFATVSNHDNIIIV